MLLAAVWHWQAVVYPVILYYEPANLDLCIVHCHPVWTVYASELQLGDRTGREMLGYHTNCKLWVGCRR
jgi:hypothetical protein